MKATKQESVKIILELSKEEAETLKDMVQNALVENESQQCEVFRGDLFLALTGALKK